MHLPNPFDILKYKIIHIIFQNFQFLFLFNHKFELIDLHLDLLIEWYFFKAQTY